MKKQIVLFIFLLLLLFTIVNQYNENVIANNLVIEYEFQINDTHIDKQFKIHELKKLYDEINKLSNNYTVYLTFEKKERIYCKYFIVYDEPINIEDIHHESIRNELNNFVEKH